MKRMDLKKKEAKASLDFSLALLGGAALAIVSLFANGMERLNRLVTSWWGSQVKEWLLNGVLLLLASLLWLTYRRWKRTAAEIAELDNILASINPDVLLVVDRDRTIRMCNGSVMKMFGCQAHEILGRTTDLLYADRRKDSGDSREIFDSVEKKKFHIGEAVGKKKNGQTIYLEIITGKLRSSVGVVLLLRDITERKELEQHQREQAEALERNNQELLRREQIMRSLIESLELSRGSLLEQRKALEKAYADLQATQAELIQAEKMAALGRFSAGVAHEVKNPLAIILGGIEFLEGKFSQDDEEARVALEKIRNSTVRADRIVKDLLQFAKPSQLKIERLDPIDMIQETLGLLEYRAPLKNITIETQFDSNGCQIAVDKNQMQQVLFNILTNAVEAMPCGGTLKVVTRRLRPSANSTNGSSYRIEVRDTGEGISQENLSRLFEPFFTTKLGHKGTGLGLSVSKKIVENHGGDVMIESTPNTGTCVAITLPIHGHKEASDHATR